MISHLAPSKVLELAQGSQDGSSSEHLERCPQCRRVALENEALRALYLETAPEPPAGLARQVSLKALQSFLATVRQRRGPAAQSLFKPLVLASAVLCLAAGLFGYRLWRASKGGEAPWSLLEAGLEKSGPSSVEGLPEVEPARPALKPSQEAAVRRATKRLLIRHAHRRGKNRGRGLTKLAKTLRRKFLEAGQEGANPSTQTAPASTTQVPDQARTQAQTPAAPTPTKAEEAGPGFSPSQAQENLQIQASPGTKSTP
jgi:hypothetical protein